MEAKKFDAKPALPASLGCFYKDAFKNAFTATEYFILQL